MALVTSVAVVVAAAILLLATTTKADWTDCPVPCRCRWMSGKKTAQCADAGLEGIPKDLNAEMQVLNVSGNAIRILQADVFKKAGLINLQRIYLRRAKLKEIHRDAFSDLIILVELDISDNEISHLSPHTFHGNERLRVLHLSGNPLRSLTKEQFPRLQHLHVLELDGCRLETIDETSFSNLPTLETLSLKNNLLKKLSETTFMIIGNLKALALDGNPWKCDCGLRAFRDWFLSRKLQSVELFCEEPAWLAGQSWSETHPEDFACPPQVFVSPDNQVQAEAGGNVSFGCHVLGDPEPQVTWLYDGRPINHTWLILEAEEGLLDKWANISVINVSEADAGLYTCSAKNSLDTVSRNVTLVLPEVVTATTLSKADPGLVYWGVVCVGVAVACSVTCTVIAVCCVRHRHVRHKRSMKASVSFTDQEKKLLDVSIATTTDRGTGSNEALGPDMELVDPPVHITIESEPLPLAVFPPPPEFSTSALPAGAFGNIFISVSVSRDPTTVDVSRCPDLLDLPHRTKPIYHGMATLPRRVCAVPQYDNMGPRVTAGGSSTLSLPDSAGDLPPPPPPPSVTSLTSEFVSL